MKYTNSPMYTMYVTGVLYPLSQREYDYPRKHSRNSFLLVKCSLLAFLSLAPVSPPLVPVHSLMLMQMVWPLL